MSFPPETFAFLEGIAAHNEKAWFEANRPLYDAGYVAAGKAFVELLGPRLRAISPEVQYEPRVNGSIGRVNRDVRFSKNKRPYKEHLGLWFWHGERRSWDQPGFYLGITPTVVQFGVGMHGFQREALDEFRQSVIHPRSGRALLAAVAAVKAAGPYEICGKTRKLLPKGLSTDADRQEYLLYEGLFTSFEIPASAARQPEFLEQCAQHFANTWPIAKWLLDEGIAQ